MLSIELEMYTRNHFNNKIIGHDMIVEHIKLKQWLKFTCLAGKKLTAQLFSKKISDAFHERNQIKFMNKCCQSIADKLMILRIENYSQN